MKEVKVAMIGYGGIARTHAKGYAALKEEGFPIKLVAVCDIDKSKFESHMNINIDNGSSVLPSDVHIYTDVKELIKNEEFDMVDICLPTYLHKEYSIMFMELGKHVLCEKPMALNSDECETMLEVSRKTGRKLMIAQCLRFNSAYQFLKDCVDNNTFGEMRHIFMHRLCALPTWGYEHWFEDESKSGGCILDTHIHDVDIARFLLGEPEAVSVCSIDNEMRWQYVNTRLFYKNTLVTINGSWDEGSSFVFSAGFRARFEKASVVLDGSNIKIYPDEGMPYVPSLPAKGQYKEEIRMFASILLEQNSSYSNNPPESSYKTVCLIEKLRESAANRGEIIKL